MAHPWNDPTYGLLDQGVRNLVYDSAYFWRRVKCLVGTDCGRNLFTARARVGDLIAYQRSRARRDDPSYSANKLMALAELSDAIARKIQEEKYGRSYL
jgi:hypothetical protein